MKRHSPVIPINLMFIPCVAVTLNLDKPFWSNFYCLVNTIVLYSCFNSKTTETCTKLIHIKQLINKHIYFNFLHFWWSADTQEVVFFNVFAKIRIRVPTIVQVMCVRNQNVKYIFLNISLFHYVYGFLQCLLQLSMKFVTQKEKYLCCLNNFRTTPVFYLNVRKKR